MVRAMPNGLRTVVARPAASGRRSVAAAAGLSIDLTGKKAFIAGVADDQGFGWAIAKALAEAGAEISLGVWVPALNIFETSFRRGKFDESRKLSNGGMLDFAHIYPMDAVFDTPEDVPEEVRTNKRYAGAGAFTVSEIAERVKADVGNIDIVVHSLANGPEVHSLANGPEVTKPLLETSRKGYLAAMSASSYSFVSMMQRFGPIMNPGGAAISLTYIASEDVIPGYGGGMSSAKAVSFLVKWGGGRVSCKWLAWDGKIHWQHQQR
uniref:Enoyl-ACP reductase n=1 Tax=Tetradesmus obliquus TaxID=3088 RepID=A0A383VQ40_TETOB